MYTRNLVVAWTRWSGHCFQETSVWWLDCALENVVVSHVVVVERRGEENEGKAVVWTSGITSSPTFVPLLKRRGFETWSNVTVSLAEEGENRKGEGTWRVTKINEDTVSSTINEARFVAAIYRELLVCVCVCVRVSAAINSRVIDGAISGATRGRILGVCRSVELEIWIVNGLNLELVLAV